MTLADDFEDRYASLGLLRGDETLRLTEECKLRGSCWGYASVGEKKFDNGITIPWIGPDYESDRIALLSLNLRGDSGPKKEEEIGSKVRRALEAGERRHFGTFFHYRTGALVNAVRTRIAGRKVPLEMPEPRAAAEALDASARLQLIKCSVNDGGRGTPRPTMAKNCRKQFLAGDLELLRPNFLIAVHTDVRAALWHEFKPHYAEAEVKELSWGDITIGGRNIPYFWTYHPTSGSWARGWRRFVETLNSLPPDLRPN